MNRLKDFVRYIYWIYSKFMLLNIHKVSLPINNAFFPPDFCDLYNLWRLTIKCSPTIILEVGSGYSTLIFAQALERISNKKHDDVKRLHYCLEQDEKYLKIIKDYIPKIFSKYIVFIKTDLLVQEKANSKMSICSNFPDIKINLFYEDRTDHKEFPIAGDAFIIEDEMPDDFTICVDGMRRTVDFYKNSLNRNYKISSHFFHGTNFVPIDA